jgi:predicted GNAT superfamily acetyltransferase
MTISISPITTIEECRHIEQLQADIWQSSELEVAPDHLIFTIAKEGGQVLLARHNETGEPVGFAYGFLGRTKTGRLKLASHQVGVAPAYQNQGVGYQLKLAQREAALADGLDLITWTYDPLQGRNARLNLHKLGAVCHIYFPNLYGPMRDELNQGLPSDRFRVEWWIATAWVADRLAGQAQPHQSLDYPVLNPATLQTDGLLAPPDLSPSPEGEFCLVEFPANLNQLRAATTKLALQWRLHTRQIFQTAFELGYTAVDMLHHEDRNYYLLQKIDE